MGLERRTDHRDEKKARIGGEIARRSRSLRNARSSRVYGGVSDVLSP